MVEIPYSQKGKMSKNSVSIYYVDIPTLIIKHTRYLRFYVDKKDGGYGRSFMCIKKRKERNGKVMFLRRQM